MCFDIFSPPPGDSDVTSQVDRLSSNETKIAPRSVRIAVGAWDRSVTICMVASRVGGSATSLCPSDGRYPLPMGSLLIDAEDERSAGRGKVETDDIAYLVDEQRIIRQLERLAAVRLQAERRRHPADRPVRRVGRGRAQRPLDHGSNLIVVDSSRSAGASFVE